MLTVNNYSVQSYGTTFTAGLQKMISLLKRYNRYNKNMNYEQVKNAYEQLKSELAMQQNKTELTKRSPRNIQTRNNKHYQEGNDLPSDFRLGKQF